MPPAHIGVRDPQLARRPTAGIAPSARISAEVAGFIRDAQEASAPPLSTVQAVEGLRKYESSRGLLVVYRPVSFTFGNTFASSIITAGVRPSQTGPPQHRWNMGPAAAPLCPPRACASPLPHTHARARAARGAAWRARCFYITNGLECYENKSKGMGGPWPGASLRLWRGYGGRRGCRRLRRSSATRLPPLGIRRRVSGRVHRPSRRRAGRD